MKTVGGIFLFFICSVLAITGIVAATPIIFVGLILVLLTFPISLPLIALGWAGMEAIGDHNGAKMQKKREAKMFQEMDKQAKKDFLSDDMEEKIAMIKSGIVTMTDLDTGKPVTVEQFLDMHRRGVNINWS